MLIMTTGADDASLIQYRDNILLKQTVTRYADAWGHLKPPWYFFTNTISWLWLPVTLLLPWLIPAWKRDWKMRKPAILLFGGWVLLVLLFFSLSDGKRSVYIFPAVPALALLAGVHAQGILKKIGPRIVLLSAGVLLAAGSTTIGVYALYHPSLLQDWLTGSGAAQSAAWRLLAIGIAGLFILAWTRLERAPAGFAAILVCTWIGMSLMIYPMINDTRSGRIIIDAVSQKLHSGDALAFACWKEQFLLQWDRPAVHFGYRRVDLDGEARDAATWLSHGINRRVLLPEVLLDPCFDRQKVEELGVAHRQRWYLVANSSLSNECGP
jgi:4-amino-4-deoxy-L-arabinose transferase-like glycosyltransferase